MPDSGGRRGGCCEDMRDGRDGKNTKSRNDRTKKHSAGKRLGRLVWYDLSYGYRSTRLKWLGAVLVQAYFAVMVVQVCSVPGASGEITGMQVAGEQVPGAQAPGEQVMGMQAPAEQAPGVQAPGEQAPGELGYLGFLLQGMPEYFLSETGKFELPVPWLMLQAYLLFLTVSYPAGDLARSGGQAIVRAGRRRDWLFGKAVWVGCTVAGYYLLLTAMVAVCALAAGGLAPEGGNAGQGFLASRYGIDLAKLGGWEIFLRWWGQPVLVSLALCLAQLAISLALEPALALFLMLGYLTASVFWASPWLLGNFSMLLRQDFLSGIPEICIRNCLLLCAAWSAGALALGAGWIGRKDIF